VEYAHKYNAAYIAHGCTGKGNDQVRFEASIMMLDPRLKIIAPLREWDLKTRTAEIEWANEHGIDVPVTKESPYSIDSNLWGRAIECGCLEDPWNEPPEEIYTITASALETPDAPEYVEIEFKAGVPCALNGQEMSFLEIINELREIAGKHGYGRIDMIESRLVGVKSRECYEVPAGLALILAHKALEDLCLERELLHYKFGIEQNWAVAVYNGEWFSPLKNALDAFCASCQADVNGTVRLKFFKGSCIVVGSKSPSSLYDFALATYDEEDAFDHAAAKGFIDIKTLSLKVWASKRLERLGEGESADQLLS
ncbi:MAG: argininosuccinate synthase, partial [Eggerthellaceae bacterium]|nr:argininosuccinate synthase [Eggerthellaceae bacterium]